jgi:hypothetical protein
MPARRRSTAMSRLLAAIVHQTGEPSVMFARAIGVTPQQLSYYMHPGRYDRPPGVLTCLKIAKVARRSALEVLRAGGKSEYATLLAELFPTAVSGTTPLSASQRDHLSLWRVMPPNVRRALSVLMIRVHLMDRELIHEMKGRRTKVRRRSSKRRIVAA